MNKTIKNIFAFGLMYSLSSPLYSAINIEKLKDKSFDLAVLIECAIKNGCPKKQGKIDVDDKGFFVKCGMPDEAINAFAYASNCKIEEFGKEKYVFAPVDDGKGIIAHLEEDRFYADRVDDLESVKKTLYGMHKPGPKINPSKKLEPKAKPNPKPKPKPEIRIPVKKNKLEEKVETPAKIIEIPDEIPDYSSVLGTIYEKNPSLSHILYCKIINQQITKEDLEEYKELEEVYDVEEKKDYVLRSSSPSADINLIKESFGVEGDTIPITSKTYLNFYSSPDGMISINRIKK